jgi:phosphoserine phosphatase RsbU/P
MSEPENRLSNVQAENTQLRRAVEELSILNELASAIGASRDVESVIQAIIRRSISAVRAEQAVVTLVGDEVSDPTQTLVRTMSSSGDSVALSPDQSLLGYMYLHKRPLVVNTPREDDRFRGVRWKDSVRSILCVPMVAQGRLTGILTLYNKKRSDTGFTHEDQRLIAILAAQSAQVVESARLYEEERQLLEMRQEVRLAHEIQANLLPSSPPTLPGFDLSGVSLPAKEVGGDFFDYIHMDDGRLAVTVGDVSGKGVPAALLMATAQATLRGQVVTGTSASESLANTNRLLCQAARKGTFVTLFLGMLDPESAMVSYANAGHNRPFVVGADGTVEILTTGSLVLGFLPTHTYELAERVLAPGETLVIYSDGVTEAMNSDGEQFEEDPLYKLAQDHHAKGPRVLIDEVIRQVQKFAGGRAQSDDITVLVVRRLPE